ncbi:cupin domain-containing protein [Halomicrobium mukohataei]|uniref:Cupin domain-containing protein n=1 Tax=Halomicrobium mukohataei TaxID=57705 RepID=A0A847UHN7_9EURY|nr:cupin domain-containing protein [Halomicrobium mukohataei]NLV11100.1 cupin domain-containing protein [Halomicrobium mukohataei]
MNHVTLASDDRDRPLAALARNRLADALGASDIALNHYRVPLGERLAGLHAHDDQAEIFVCLDGTMTFETLDGECTLRTGEAVRFAPGEFQSGKNDGDATATVLAIGTPRDTGALRVPVACCSCGNDRTEPRVRGGETVLACPACGHESVVECPECGSGDVRAELGQGGAEPVSVCQECGNSWAAR